MKRAAILLLVALGGTGRIALAQDPATELRSCLQKEHADRLGCLNRLTRSIAPQNDMTPASRLNIARRQKTTGSSA